MKFFASLSLISLFTLALLLGARAQSPEAPFDPFAKETILDLGEGTGEPGWDTPYLSDLSPLIELHNEYEFSPQSTERPERLNERYSDHGDPGDQNWLVAYKVLQALFRLPSYQSELKNLETARTRFRALNAKSFEALKPAYARLIPSEANTLSFTNDPKMFESVFKMTIGFCWGHATVTRLLNTLATFNPSNRPATVSVRDYETRIDTLLRGKPVAIPGFKNIREFSSHPLLRPMLMRKVAEEWGNKTVRVTSLSLLTSPSSEMSWAKQEQFLRELKTRTSRYQVPKLAVAEFGKFDSMHIILAYDVKFLPSGEVRVCINDNAEPARVQTECGRYLTFKKGLRPYYPRWKWVYGNGDLRSVGFVPEEESEILGFLKNL